jgi:hypothetical protein
MCQLTSINHHPHPANQYHTQPKQQEDIDIPWHVPNESLTSTIHQPSEEYIGKENIPHVQALNTSETLGEIQAPHNSRQQDQTAETLEPVLPGINQKDSNKNVYGQLTDKDNHI